MKKILFGLLALTTLGCDPGSNNDPHDVGPLSEVQCQERFSCGNGFWDETGVQSPPPGTPEQHIIRYEEGGTTTIHPVGDPYTVDAAYFCRTVEGEDLWLAVAADEQTLVIYQSTDFNPYEGIPSPTNQPSGTCTY